MSRTKRFRRLSALTSVLLASTSPIAHAQSSPPPGSPPAQRKIPTTQQECDELSSDVFAVAVEKIGIDGFTDYLKASNIDRSLPQLCAEGNFEAAHAIAMQEIRGFEAPSEPDRTRQSTMPSQCVWDGNGSGWSASAGAGEYTLGMFAEVTEFDDDLLSGSGSRFTIDSSWDSPGFRYRLEVPVKDGYRPQAVDVELSVGGSEPKRASVPMIAESWADISKVMPQVPVYFAKHVVKVSENGKPLMTATFQPSAPGDIMGQAETHAARLKKSYDGGGCVKRQCFLTTACCELIGLDDDCFELRALRAFRDTALPVLPGGARDIALYYGAAPLILDAMRRTGSERMLLRYYASHILPCAVLATLGFNSATQRHYRDLMRRLSATYAPATASLLDS